MDRRNALRILALGATSPLLQGLSASELMALGQQAHARIEPENDYRSLIPRHHRIVRVAIDHILPETDTPGAVDAGVDRFIDVVLADWYSADERERFLAGLDELDQWSRDRHDASFVDSAIGEQVQLLESVDEDHFDDPNHWFGMLKHLTIWGYFTSEMGVTQELSKHTKQGMWQGCATLPGADELR